MSRPLLLTTALLGLALSQVPAHAQALNGATQNPPAPNSAQSAPQPLNSLPRGGATGVTTAPGNSIDTTQVGPSTPPPRPTQAVNTLHPLRQPRRAVRRPARGSARPASSSASTPTQQ